LTEVAKNAEKEALRGSRSLNLAPIERVLCDFVLVINTNLDGISHEFGAMVT